MPRHDRVKFGRAFLLCSTAWGALLGSSDFQPSLAVSAGNQGGCVVLASGMSRNDIPNSDLIGLNAGYRAPWWLRSSSQSPHQLGLTNPCQPMSPPPSPPPPPVSCFPAGTLVEMADGRLLPIERVAVGEFVRGRYGEANEVMALDRTWLGARPLYLINGEHYTTAEHPHWTSDGPMAVDPGALGVEWGTFHPVVLGDGKVEEWRNIGLTRPVGPLRIGALAVYRSGFKAIKSIERCSLSSAPPLLPLYNLVLGGSHTMRIDGYLVTGWPQEVDFDYDGWRPTGIQYRYERRMLAVAA